MGEILKIGKTLYEIDDQTKTYWFYGRNPDKVSQEEEEQNKRKIDGSTRHFKDRRTKKFRYKN
jgi:hypothetical protein